MSELFYSDFTGGMNDTTPPELLKDNELVLCENAFPHPRGGIEKRKGCTKYVNYQPSGKVTEWLHSDGTSYLIRLPNSLAMDIEFVEDTGLVGQDVQLGVLSYFHDVLAHFQYMDRFYFVAKTSEHPDDQPVYTYCVWGDYQYTTDSGTVTLKNGDIIKNHPYNGTGIAGHFYKYTLDTQTTIDLKTFNFQGMTDITYKSIPNFISIVTPYSDPTNYLDPIKKCTIMVLHQPSKRIFAAGNPDDPGALYFSEIDKPNYFKKTSKIYPTNSEGPITGLVCVEESILVSYKRGWYAYTGIFPGIDAVWKPLNIPVGAVNNNAICLTPNSVTFVSEKDIWIMNPAALRDDFVKIPTNEIFLNISENKVKNTMKTIQKHELIRTVFHEDKLYIAYNDWYAGSACDYVLVFDWNTKSFIKITGWRGITEWCSRYNGDLLFSTQTGYLLKTFSGETDFDGYNEKEVSISLNIKTKSYGLDSYHKKMLNMLYMDTKTYDRISHFDINIVSESFNDYLVASLLNICNSNEHFNYQNFISDIEKSGFKFQVSISDSAYNNTYNTLNPTANPIYIYTIGFIFNVLSDIADAPKLGQPLLIDNYQNLNDT